MRFLPDMKCPVCATMIFQVDEDAMVCDTSGLRCNFVYHMTLTAQLEWPGTNYDTYFKDR